MPAANYALFFRPEGPGLLVQELALDFPRKSGFYIHRLVGPQALVEAFLEKFSDRTQRATNDFIIQQIDSDQPAVKLLGVTIEEVGIGCTAEHMQVREQIKAYYTEQQPHERRPTP